MSGESESLFSRLPTELAFSILEHLDILSKRSARHTCFRWRYITKVGDEESPFFRLPDNIILKILKYTNLYGQKSSRIVCGHWRYIIDQNRTGGLFFSPFISNNRSVRFLLNTKREIENLYITNISETTELNIHKFPHIKNVMIKQNIAPLNIMAFLRFGCENVQRMGIGNFSLEHIIFSIPSPPMPEIKWNNLQHLELQIMLYMDYNTSTYCGVGHINAMIGFLKMAKTPNIKILILKLVGGYYKQAYLIMLEIYKFISTNSKKLKEIHFKMTKIDSVSIEISGNAADIITQNLNLDKLSVNAEHYFNIKNTVPQCMLQSTALKELTWKIGIHTDLNNEGAINESAKKQINMLIERNCSSLTKINLMASHLEQVFELYWLCNCLKLTKLCLQNFQKFITKEILLPNIVYLELRDECPWPVNFDAWVIRNFKNVETLKLYSDNYFSHLPTIQLELGIMLNLLNLSHLKEFIYWSKQHGHFNGFEMNYDQEIREHCRHDHRLTYQIGPNPELNGCLNERTIRINQFGNLFA